MAPEYSGDPPTHELVSLDFATGAVKWHRSLGLPGVDQRVIDGRDLEEVSIGDFILSGGEPAALAVLDAVVRLLPGVMGNEESGREESFENGLLEHPHYTRPRLFEGQAIPEVLSSGDHGRIAAWRRSQAERLTAERRPDLLAASSGKKSSAKA